MLLADVGQADGIFITDEAKSCKILIDSGDTRDPDSSKNFRAYLAAQLPAGAEIDLAIASHPHSDHIGSMKWVRETYRVKTYVDNGQEHSSVLARGRKIIAKITSSEVADGDGGRSCGSGLVPTEIPSLSSSDARTASATRSTFGSRSSPPCYRISHMTKFDENDPHESPKSLFLARPERARSVDELVRQAGRPT